MLFSVHKIWVTKQIPWTIFFYITDHICEAQEKLTCLRLSAFHKSSGCVQRSPSPSTHATYTAQSLPQALQKLMEVIIFPLELSLETGYKNADMQLSPPICYCRYVLLTTAVVLLMLVLLHRLDIPISSLVFVTDLPFLNCLLQG